ncbi:MAG: heme lyase CcmF/NrfE family subunit, partial [Candidatus Limnocylindria bacterium]
MAAAVTYADVGAASLRLALVAAACGFVAAALAAWRLDTRWLRSARWAALAALVLAVVAAVTMVGALVAHDFSIRYVAQNNARETPLFYTVISLWAALEGSILLWIVILAGAAAWVAWQGTRAVPRLAATALAVLFGMLVFFLFLVVTPAADPFVTISPVPENGRGPNELLQNHPLMALHPPLLYLGYVLFSIPFAYAIAALVLGEAGDRWLVLTRGSALTSWALLGLGLAAGAWWGYAVLGWGGYWAWDPVENAALMPWLTATAYLHSVMVEEKRGMLRTWNLTLVIATFALVIFGTFLTRSGAVNSVHSFTQSAIGPILLGYLVAIVVLSVGLLVWRAPRLADRGAVGAPLSREAIFLFQNVLFVTATLAVLLGTVYPLFVEALTGRPVSIGGPYFNRVEVPIALALLFLMGVGPQLPWHGASRSTLERQFALPAVGAALASVLAFALGERGAFAVLTYALAVFVLATVVQEYARGVRARRTLHGEGTAVALASLVRRNGRRYGGYVVHVGIVLAAVAITASQTRTLTVEQTLAPGGTLVAGPYTVRLESLREVREPQRTQMVADLRVTGAGSDAALPAALTFYPNLRGPVGTPGILAGLGQDVYAVLAAYDDRSRAWATLSVRVIPLQSWLWIGAGVVGVGAIMAALPPPRRRREL